MSDLLVLLQSLGKANIALTDNLFFAIEAEAQLEKNQSIDSTRCSIC